MIPDPGGPPPTGWRAAPLRSAAVIVLPDDERAAALASAAQYAPNQGYELLAIAPALRMVADGHADVAVAAAAEHLPEVEFADWPRRPGPVPRKRAAPDNHTPPTRRRPRPIGWLDGSGAHFHSLRNTRAHQRAKAVAHVQQMWDLTLALEKRVQLPLVDLPGFTGGEMHASVDVPRTPVAAARTLRAYWGLDTGPIAHLVRHLEAHSTVVDTASRRR